MEINIGAPIIPVITPIGSSFGENTVRAKVSTTIRPIPPRRIEVHKRSSCFTPIIFLEMWGTIRPTKPITPTFETTKAMARNLL